MIKESTSRSWDWIEICFN